MAHPVWSCEIAILDLVNMQSFKETKSVAFDHLCMATGKWMRSSTMKDHTNHIIPQRKNTGLTMAGKCLKCIRLTLRKVIRSSVR